MLLYLCAILLVLYRIGVLKHISDWVLPDGVTVLNTLQWKRGRGSAQLNTLDWLRVGGCMWHFQTHYGGKEMACWNTKSCWKEKRGGSEFKRGSAFPQWVSSANSTFLKAHQCWLHLTKAHTEQTNTFVTSWGVSFSSFYQLSTIM